MAGGSGHQEGGSLESVEERDPRFVRIVNWTLMILFALLFLLAFGAVAAAIVGELLVEPPRCSGASPPVSGSEAEGSAGRQRAPERPHSSARRTARSRPRTVGAA